MYHGHSRVNGKHNRAPKTYQAPSVPKKGNFGNATVKPSYEPNHTVPVYRANQLNFTPTQAFTVATILGLGLFAQGVGAQTPVPACQPNLWYWGHGYPVSQTECHYEYQSNGGLAQGWTDVVRTCGWGDEALRHQVIVPDNPYAGVLDGLLCVNIAEADCRKPAWNQVFLKPRIDFRNLRACCIGNDTLVPWNNSQEITLSNWARSIGCKVDPITPPPVEETPPAPPVIPAPPVSNETDTAQDDTPEVVGISMVGATVLGAGIAVNSVMVACIVKSRKVNKEIRPSTTPEEQLANVTYSQPQTAESEA